MSAPSLRFRHPTEADHLPLVRVVDEWWGGRRLRQLLPRLWLQHFSGTSWIAEADDGRLAGFLVGFVSQDRPDEAYVHMVAASPNHRRRGVGRALYEQFFAEVRARGVTRVTAITWPGNRASVAFHQAMGFRLLDGPGSQSIYGVPAFSDYDDERDDKAVMVRHL